MGEGQEGALRPHVAGHACPTAQLRIASFKALARTDFALMALLGGLAAAMSLYLGAQVENVVRREFMNFWFGADSPRIFENLTDRSSNHYRTSVHPLFSLLVAAPALVLVKVLGISAVKAVLGLYAVAAALAAGLLYVAVRLFTPVLDAAIYSMLFLASAAFVFWFGVPESFAWGSVSMLLAIVVAIGIPYGRGSAAVVMASALSMSMTVTNWMAGLIAAWVSQPWPRAVRLSIYAFALVAVLTPVQDLVFPSAGKFLNLRQERRYVSAKHAFDATGTAANLLINSMVAPRPRQVERKGATPHSQLTSENGSLDGAGKLAAAAWMGMLLMGLWALSRESIDRRLRLTIGLTLLGQLGLHLLYGDEPFLYAAHYTPLLILLSALASATPARRFALALAVIVVLAGGFNNLGRFSEAAAMLNSARPALGATCRADFGAQQACVPITATTALRDTGPPVRCDCQG